MKRSADVTVVAILLMLAGGLGVVLTSISSTAGPKMFEAQLQQAEAQLSRVSVGTGEGQAPPGQVEAARRSLQKIRGEILPMLNSPTTRCVNGVGVALSAAACVAGVGILLLQGWARQLITWQAALSIPFTVWSSLIAGAFQQRLSNELLDLTANPSMQPFQQAVQIGQWIGIVMVIAWNGFIVWFFHRAAVKAQFKSAEHV